MAHGIIPPLSDHLICNDFLLKVSLVTPVDDDVRLLGNAANGMIVGQDFAGMLQEVLKQAYASYRAVGYPVINPTANATDVDSRHLLALLLGVALRVDDAAVVLGTVLPRLQDEDFCEWRCLINGALEQRIQSIESAVGAIIRENAKDVVLHGPLEGGFDDLEQALCCA